MSFVLMDYRLSLVWILLLWILIFLIIIIILAYRLYHKKCNVKSDREIWDLLEMMPDMVVVCDQYQRIEKIINPHEMILLGLKPQELIGMSATDIAERIPEFSEVVQLIREHTSHTFLTHKVSFFSYQVTYRGVNYYAEMRILPFEKEKIICFIHDASLRITAEKEAIKYKKFLQSVIDHLPLGIFVKNVSDDYRYIFYNQGVKNFYQEEKIEYLGKNDFELKDSRAEQYRLEDEEVLKSENPLSFDREFIDSQGRMHWGITTKVRLLNNDGSYYIISILVDITNERKHEMELENMKNELSIALDAGSLSAWNYNIEQRLFTSLYNETSATENLTCVERYNIIHPEDREKYTKLIDDLAFGRCQKKKEIVRFFRNGKYGWFEIHAAGICSTLTGKVVRIVGTEKNITEELQKQLELEESKFKIDFVIKSNGIVQWDYDIQKQIFSSSNIDSFMHSGISKEDYMLLVHPDDRQLIEEALGKMLTNQATSMNIQIRIKLSSSEYRWVDIHAVIFKKDKEGKVLQLTGLRRDITDWKTVMEELIMLREKADESNRLKSAFLANMSHEIRTPLNAIVGFSNLMAHTHDPKEIKQYCDVIETNNELLLQLINDILDLSKIEAGQLEFSFSEVQMSQLFLNLQQIYQLKMKEGVELRCELPAEDCIIYTEKNRLTQVISNFLTNASKFTVSGQIRMGYQYTDKGLRFYVADTGIGIAAEHIPHVFERFIKLNTFAQGTGLGLSICQTIVRRLGGEIGVNSELGKGSTFWFTIPCKINFIRDKSQPEKWIAKEEMNVLLKNNGQKLIVVAEDNDSNYLLLSSILKAKYQLKRAINGKEAVHLFHTFHPALILMDIRMPVMGGLEATAQIRKIDNHLPIIALSANAFEEDREKALAVGCTDYLTKPVKVAQLLNTIEEYISA